MDPDRDLVEQIQSGNDRAFTELMARYKKPVLNFIYRMTGDAGDADDVAQETFVRIYRHIAKFKFRAGAKFSTWLFQTARNTAIDHLRRRKKHLFQSLENSGADFPIVGNDPARESHLADVSQAIARAMAELPEEQRTAILLAEYHGLSYAEISAVMVCSEKSVESRLYRAKQALRLLLKNLL